MRNGINEITSEEEKKHNNNFDKVTQSYYLNAYNGNGRIFFVCMRLHLAQCFVLIRRRCCLFQLESHIRRATTEHVVI